MAVLWQAIEPGQCLHPVASSVFSKWSPEIEKVIAQTATQPKK